MERTHYGYGFECAGVSTGNSAGDSDDAFDIVPPAAGDPVPTDEGFCDQMVAAAQSLASAIFGYPTDASAQVRTPASTVHLLDCPDDHIDA